MELNPLNEEMSLWDGELLMGDPFAQVGKYDNIQAKLPGLVWQDIADPDNGINFAVQVEEFKPGLDDFPSELFQNSHQLQYDDELLQEWMLEKMDFNLIEMMNSHGNSDDLFNFVEFGFNDTSNSVKSDLESAFPEHAIGLSELTPPVSPENKEIIEINNELQCQHLWKNVCCKSVSESHVEHCRTASEIMLQTPPVSPEFNYFSEISPDTRFGSDQSINSISFPDSSLSKQQPKRTVRNNRKPVDSSNLKAKTSVLKNVNHTKKDRKRSQNRNAATKYRIKKRSELDNLQQQRDHEETRNKELKTKISEISREVNYLKELMKEIMGSKGPKI